MTSNAECCKEAVVADEHNARGRVPRASSSSEEQLQRVWARMMSRSTAVVAPQRELTAVNDHADPVCSGVKHTRKCCGIPAGSTFTTSWQISCGSLE